MNAKRVVSIWGMVLLAFCVSAEAAWGSDSIKIDPRLESVPGGSLVRVIVYLSENPNFGIARSIRSQYQPSLAAIGGELRAIVRKDHLTERDQSDVKRLRRQADEVRTAMTREIIRTVRMAIRPQQKGLQQTIERLGGFVGHKFTVMNAVTAFVPVDRLEQLARSSSVRYISQPQPSEPHMSISVEAIGADTFWPTYNGDGFDFGIVDAGVDSVHNMLDGHRFYYSPVKNGQNGRPIIISGYNPDADHGTRCAGIAIGEPTVYGSETLKGVAYGADDILSAGYSPDQGHQEAFDWIVVEAPDSLGVTAEVINHSASPINVSTDYPVEAQFLDAVIDDYDVLVAQSAGNEGPNDETLAHYATSFNALVVGAVDDGETDPRSNDTVTSWSSRGPTDSGRCKPDLVAPGKDILSPDADGVNSFSEDEGTSFAAPHVAGACLLLQDEGVTNIKVIRAILINTADSLGQRKMGWDNAYGWGEVNLDSAYAHRDHYDTWSVTQGTATTREYEGTLYPNEKVTLVWNKHVTYEQGDPPGVDDVYDLTDLDLYLEDSSGDTLDSSTSDIDNVEQVRLPSNESGQAVTIVVTLDGSFPSGIYGESFALAFPRSFSRVTSKPVAPQKADGVPGVFALSQNHPNPFNPETTIQFTLPDEHQARLTIHNISGQQVTTLLDEQMPKGNHSAVWNGKDATGKDVASGVYFYQLTAGDFTATRKMLLIR